VLVDIPKDVLPGRRPFSLAAGARPARLSHPTTRPHAKQVREAARLLVQSRRPVLYVGGGVIRARASEVLRKLVDLTGIPVVTTLMARGALPDSHPPTSACRACTAPSPRSPPCSAQT
jgi:acetolactate synthase-1/2/3 large subunit